MKRERRFYTEREKEEDKKTILHTKRERWTKRDAHAIHTCRYTHEHKNTQITYTRKRSTKIRMYKQMYLWQQTHKSSSDINTDEHTKSELERKRERERKKDKNRTTHTRVR